MTSPQQYTPREYTALDTVQAAKRTADAILRSNPLTNAVISHGLMRWTGNHLTGSGAKIDHLWIGEFFPPDTSLGGIPQKGFSLVRDDSTGGTPAFQLYDHDPGGGGLGLRQTIHLESLDDQRLMSEARTGGQQWPEENIVMGPLPRAFTEWTGTPITPDNAWWTLWEGRANVLGNQIVARYWAASTSGATSEFRIRFEGIGGDVIGPVRTLGAGLDGVFEDTITVSADRGFTRTFRLEARTTNLTGRARMQYISARCYTP